MSLISKIFIFLLCFVSFLDAKTVILSAIVEYENNSNKNFSGISQSFTIPENRFYQKLIKISPINIENFQIRKHKNKKNKYIAFKTNIPAHSKIIKKIDFEIELNNQYIDLSKTKLKTISQKINENKRIKAITNLIDKNNSDYEQLKNIFSFPSNYLTYKPQNKTSVDKALETGIGDCTEYSMLFNSLANQLGIKSRTVSVFNFKNKKKFKLPNHDISEIYVQNQGWIPMYPNLSLGKLDSDYSPGNISDSILIYKHINWTWSGNLKRIDKDRVIKREIFFKIREK